MNLVVLFRELDMEKTAEATEEFLSNFKDLLMRAGEGYALLKSPQITGMPKPPSFENNADMDVVERTNALYLVKTIIATIHKLDPKSQKILNALYIEIDKKNISWLSDDLHYSRTKIYEFKERALVSFAEAYKAENLRVFKEKENEEETEKTPKIKKKNKLDTFYTKSLQKKTIWRQTMDKKP